MGWSCQTYGDAYMFLGMFILLVWLYFVTLALGEMLPIFLICKAWERFGWHLDCFWFWGVTHHAGQLPGRTVACTPGFH